MEEKFKKIQEILKKENQQQMLVNYNNLNNDQKELLLNQILEINFEEMKKLYENIGKNIENSNSIIESIPYVEKDKIKDIKYFEKGAEIVRENKLAVVTMAGGQGTRLRT